MIPLTRRDFLKTMSMAGGALLAGCAPALASPASTASNNKPEATAIPTQGLETAASPTPPPTPTQDPSASAISPPRAEALPPVTENKDPFPLPAPRLDGGLAIMQALSARHSTRAFGTQDLSIQELSDLLWAGFGVNRPASGGRTAPSAYDVQDIDIYLTTDGGLYRYSASDHALLPLLASDLRASTGTQAYVATAPANLVYVSDYRKMAAHPAERDSWAWAHSGFIAQNVYLACASLGLATVVRSTIDRNILATRMKLSADQHITLAQTIGHPA